jgi:lysyl-tRNA synthetase, class II
VTAGVRDTLRKRAQMMSVIRRFLEGRGFLEVETPVLESSAGGADARPFTTYHNALQQPYVLRIATGEPSAGLTYPEDSLPCQ